jgi:AcrR family transcriptional regulator
MTVTEPIDNKGRASARDRLLAAATQLFDAQGIQTVGVDRIIEHAGVSRGSFYNNFDSKQQLIHSYLRWHHDHTTAQLSEAIARQSDPRLKILAVFATQAARIRQPDFNGCAFVAASTEAPPGGVIERDAADFRTWIRTMFTDLAQQAGAPDPGHLGRQLHVLYDGTGLTARMDHDPDIATATRTAVEALLDAALTWHRCDG